VPVHGHVHHGDDVEGLTVVLADTATEAAAVLLRGA
jgi:hypothetical protein